MGLDPALAAAITFSRRRVAETSSRPSCALSDDVFQLSLAHVLLDGAYDGVVSLSDVLGNGDHGLGTIDRLDGELVVVDGTPWQIDSTGAARVLPPDTRTPFVVLSTMVSPLRRRLQNVNREQVLEQIDEMVDDPSSIASVRLEGTFRRVLVRSVPAQSPPYRPYAEVCATDEVRWEIENFEGVFVGFRFPGIGATNGAIGGLHLHGLDHARSTGGHNHELEVHDAELSVSVTREFAVGLPDRAMSDLLEMPPEIRATQRLLLRRGASTLESISAALSITPHEAQDRLTWLVDRGFAGELGDAIDPLGGQLRWRATLHRAGARRPTTLTDLLIE
jgi:acetolactate decarboxylase